MALSPMKWQRWATSTPGHDVSTMNAVICRFSLPFTTFDGVRAMTTSSSATVPLVHHSFSPLRIQAWPSSEGTAVVSIAAGSEPTFGSVSANADTAPLARRGKNFFFCAPAQNSLGGGAPPMDWGADTSGVREPPPEEISSTPFMYEGWDSPSPP